MTECFDRAKMIKEKILDAEDAERLATKDARELVYEYLLNEKGFSAGDIEIDEKFTVRSAEVEESVSVDYIVKLNGRRFMAIKCSMALESRERHILAISRVVDSYQIPLSVVTDGLKAHLIDTITGKVVSEHMDGIPSKTQSLMEIEKMEFKQFPQDKLDKQKRILLAFECSNCPKGTSI